MEGWPLPALGGVGVMIPAGGDRFLGMGKLAVLAGAHEEADTSSKLGNDYTEDLCWFPFRWGKCERFEFGGSHQCQLPRCKYCPQNTETLNYKQGKACLPVLRNDT